MVLPKISVITVSYNQGEFITQNIESVLAQGYPNFEHIIVDGGSTDSTIDILKSYPHLKWTSGSDRGQSDALNQGFQRATGEYIAWLNSDDWYAPNIFFDVAQALSEYPVVLGAAEQTDRAGKTTEVVPNVPRSYHDLWRYWVPYAWLAQPSVFFRKSLLDEVKRSDGTYIDEDLYFTMDFDLWLRMAQRYPFTKYIPKTLSYFRIYEDNKTGAHPLATQRECTRVFRRHANQGMDSEQKLSVIIPVDQPSEELKKTIISLAGQRSLDFDIVLVDYAQDKQTSKFTHSFTLDLSEAVSHLTVRYVKSEHPHKYAALHTGVLKACAPLVTFLEPGDTVAPEFSLQTTQAFSRDVVGIVINDPSTVNQFYPQTNTLNVAAPLTMPHSFPHWTIRRSAYLELNSFNEYDCYPLAQKKLLLGLIFRNWSLECIESPLITSPTRENEKEKQFLEKNSAAITYAVILDLKQQWQNVPFASLRSVVRNPAILFDALPENAEQALSEFGEQWKKI